MTVSDAAISQTAALSVHPNSVIEEIKNSILDEVKAREQINESKTSETVPENTAMEINEEPAEKTSPGQRRRSSRLSLSAERRRPILDADTGDEEDIEEDHTALKTTPKTPKTPKGAVSTNAGKRGRPKKIKADENNIVSETVSANKEEQHEKPSEQKSTTDNLDSTEVEGEPTASTNQPLHEIDTDSVTPEGFVVLEKTSDIPLAEESASTEVDSTA
jgi:hypothetical protein